MKRMSRIAIIVLVVLGVAGVLFSRMRSEDGNGKAVNDARVVTFVEDDEFRPYLMFSVDVGNALSPRALASVALDINEDGVFGDDEVLVKNYPVSGKAGVRSNVYVPFSNVSALPRKVKVGVFVSDAPGARFDAEKAFSKVIEIENQTVVDLFELAKVTKPEEAMKGGLVAIARAEESDIFRPGVPDLRQRIAECAPTAAANSILSLAAEHDATDKLPANPLDLIDQLKGEMDWTPANGALPDQFVEGKNQLAARLGLPIRTAKVGDQYGLRTISELESALQEGGAAELRLTFADAAGKKSVGGHMVTVTGVHHTGDQTFIDVNDPASPDGTDTYEVRGNSIAYPFHDGVTVLSWGFTQTWESVETEPMTAEEIRGIERFAGERQMIKVIPFGNKKIPLSEVHVGKGPECDNEQQQFPHYHANNPAGAKAVDGSVILDPGGCGFGKVQNVPVEDFELP